MRQFSTAPICCVVLLLSAAAHVSAQTGWHIASAPTWRCENLAIDGPSASAAWGVNFSKSTAHATPTIVEFCITSKATATTAGLFEVTKDCGADPTFWTRQSSGGQLFVDEYCSNMAGFAPNNTFPAQTSSDRKATLTGIELNPGHDPDTTVERDESTEVLGYGYDSESDIVQFNIAARQKFTDRGYVKVFLYTRAEAWAFGYPAVAHVSLAKVWGGFNCNAE